MGFKKTSERELPDDPNYTREFGYECPSGPRPPGRDAASHPGQHWLDGGGALGRRLGLGQGDWLSDLRVMGGRLMLHGGHLLGLRRTRGLRDALRPRRFLAVVFGTGLPGATRRSWLSSAPCAPARSRPSRRSWSCGTVGDRRVGLRRRRSRRRLHGLRQHGHRRRPRDGE